MRAVARLVDQDPRLSIRDCCERYGVSRITWWNWGRRGLIPEPGSLPNGSPFWRRSWLDEMDARLGDRAGSRLIHRGARLAVNDCCRRYGISRHAWTRWRRKGLVPEPAQLPDGRPYWRESWLDDLDAKLGDRGDARPRGLPGGS